VYTWEGTGCEPTPEPKKIRLRTLSCPEETAWALFYKLDMGGILQGTSILLSSYFAARSKFFDDIEGISNSEKV